MDEELPAATRSSLHADVRHSRPYAYVGPWTPREGAFWNADFGALRFAEELSDTAEAVAFIAAGRAVAADSGLQG